MCGNQNTLYWWEKAGYAGKSGAKENRQVDSQKDVNKAIWLFHYFIQDSRFKKISVLTYIMIGKHMYICTYQNAECKMQCQLFLTRWRYVHITMGVRKLWYNFDAKSLKWVKSKKKKRAYITTNFVVVIFLLLNLRLTLPQGTFGRNCVKRVSNVLKNRSYAKGEAAIAAAGVNSSDNKCGSDTIAVFVSTSDRCNRIKKPYQELAVCCCCHTFYYRVQFHLFA